MGDIFETVLGIILSFVVLFVFAWGIYSVIDGTYINPIASMKANEFCRNEGYDHYGSYRRIGLFSKEPIAIRCTYVENYKDIDLHQIKETEGVE